MSDDTMSTDEVAARLQVSGAWIRARAHRMPRTTKVGGSWRIPADVGRNLFFAASDDPIRTPGELAETYGCTERMIQRWCAAGRVPGAQKIGKVWRIPQRGFETVERDGPTPPER